MSRRPIFDSDMSAEERDEALAEWADHERDLRIDEQMETTNERNKMNTQIELTKHEPMEVAAPTPAGMMLQMVARGVTSENVAAFEKLAELQWRFEERDAERTYNRAFAEFQADVIGKIHATKAIPGRNGEVRAAYAPFEDIMEQLKPHLAKHGFSVSFTEPAEVAAGRVARVCVVRHIAGHKQETRNTMRVSNSAMIGSDTQNDGAAIAYCKRYALCDALAIPIDKDTDARTETEPVTEAQAQELQRRVMETESNEAAFLKFCGVTVAGKPGLDHYRAIPGNRYEACDDMLSKKEARGR